jgi:hypothetical protein
MLFLLLSFQPNFPNVDMPEGDRDLLPINTTTSQDPEVPPKSKILDRSAEYIGRIADLEGRVGVLKQQIMNAIVQAEKSASLSQKVSSL